MSRLNALISFLFIGVLVLFSVLHFGREGRAQEQARVVMRAPSPEERLHQDFWRRVRATPAPALSAESYLVRLIGMDEPLLKQREWKRFAPASITKVLTALLAREELPSAAWVKISEHASNVEPKKSGAAVGEEFLRDDAIRFALISSANDVARALAEEIGRKYGGATPEERFVVFRELMNQKGFNIGMRDSWFQNPTGLDADEHFATAEDLARLAEYVWQYHPVLWEVSRTIEITVSSRIGTEYEFISTNDLLREVPAVLGGKTGFTDEAGETFLLLYPVKPDQTAVLVLLGSEDRFEDSRKVIRWLEEISQDF